MQNKEEYIRKILDEIFDKCNEVSSQREKLFNFIKLTVNGDSPTDYLIINANLSNDEEGIVVYILTNVRLIKMDIGIKSAIQSSSFILDSIINIERKLLDADRMQVRILFPNDAFGLRYPVSDIKASNFFQSLDQARVRKD